MTKEELLQNLKEMNDFLNESVEQVYIDYCRERDLDLEELNAVHSFVKYMKGEQIIK